MNTYAASKALADNETFTWPGGVGGNGEKRRWWGGGGAGGWGGGGGLAITLPSTNAKSVCVWGGGGGVLRNGVRVDKTLREGLVGGGGGERGGKLFVISLPLTTARG